MNICTHMDINEYSLRPIRSWTHHCRSTSCCSGELLHFSIVKLRLKAKEYLILKRNYDLEIQTNQMFKIIIHADYVLFHDCDKIIIINEDDFDHDEKGLMG